MQSTELDKSDIRRRGAAYAKTMSTVFDIDEMPGLVTRKLDATVSLLEGTARCEAFSAPLPIDDAFVLLVRQVDCRPYQLWIDGHYMPTGNLKAGTSSIFDLRTSPYSLAVGHFRHVHFYLPRKTLNAIADSEGLGHISEISYANGFANQDPVLTHLSQTLEMAFKAPERANSLFVDHIATAVTGHFLKTYGQLRFSEPTTEPRLSARQENCAKEMLSANLDGSVTLHELAAACDMPVRRFKQAFRAQVGVAPHNWLQRHRIERALGLLQSSKEGLPYIARDCGFTDTDHLTDIFLNNLGNPPEAFQAFTSSRTFRRQ